MIDIVEGWTEPIDIQLQEKVNGAYVAANPPNGLAGCTVTPSVSDFAGATCIIRGSVSVIDASNSKVRLALNAADLPASGSPYRLTFKVVDGSGQVSFAPSGPPIKIGVRKA